MHAGQVIDLQADLIDRFKTAYFNRVVTSTLNVDSEERAEALTKVIAKHVENAYAYHVNADMSELVLHAADMLDDTDVVDLSLPPTQIGIVRFDKPLPLRDARGKMMKVHWMTWGPGSIQNEFGKYETGILTTTWNDLEDPDEVALEMFDPYSKPNQKTGISAKDMSEHLDEFKRAIGRWSIVGTSLMFPGDEIDSKYLPLNKDNAARIEEEGDTPFAFTNTDRFAHALWLLMNQTIVDSAPEELTGPFKKRALRKNLPSRVTVIRLRRKSHHNSEAGESSVEWQHRWIVRGHWRWQPYGPGRTEHKRIWVNGHIKGPEGLPFKQTEKVYSLVR